jgi:hypothetical protein
MKIDASTRERVESLAIEAANDRVPREDACPYPFNSEEGLHFTAVYLVTLPTDVALPRRIPFPAGNTDCPELRDTHHRAGSSAQREIPSRWGNELRYRDGTVTDLQGKLLRRRT